MHVFFIFLRLHKYMFSRIFILLLLPRNHLFS